MTRIKLYRNLKYRDLTTTFYRLWEKTEILKYSFEVPGFSSYHFSMVTVLPFSIVVLYIAGYVVTVIQSRF